MIGRRHNHVPCIICFVDASVGGGLGPNLTEDSQAVCLMYGNRLGVALDAPLQQASASADELLLLMIREC